MNPAYSATLTVEQAQQMVRQNYLPETTRVLTVANDDAHSGMFDWHFMDNGASASAVANPCCVWPFDGY